MTTFYTPMKITFVYPTSCPFVLTSVDGKGGPVIGVDVGIRLAETLFLLVAQVFEEILETTYLGIDGLCHLFYIGYLLALSFKSNQLRLDVFKKKTTIHSVSQPALGGS